MLSRSRPAIKEGGREILEYKGYEHFLRVAQEVVRPNQNSRPSDISQDMYFAEEGYIHRCAQYNPGAMRMFGLGGDFMQSVRKRLKPFGEWAASRQHRTNLPYLKIGERDAGSGPMAGSRECLHKSGIATEISWI